MSQAVLYVELVPTTKGIKGKVEGEFGPALDGVEKKADGVFTRIGNGIKGVATATAAVFATVAGMAITGGISRLLNIEDAQAKLKGLGHDAASVDQIMSNALDAVKGTAYTLDDAATTAATATAAGIKPGQELAKYLKLTADAATIAGTSLGEMGAILNKVTASGRASAENINQLQERGIPIMQWLADEYGVTQDALSDMVSAGEVDAETFRRAIEKNISGAALASGDTTRGAFGIMLTSLSRIGAGLVGGVFPLFKEVFQGITDLLVPLEEKAASLGDAIGSKVTPLVEGLMSAVSGGLPDLSGLSGLLGPLAGAFAALGASGLGGIIAKIPLLGGLAGPLSALGGPIGIVAGALAGLVAVSPQLQEALGGVFSTLMDVAGELGKSFAPILAQLLPLVSNIAQMLGGVLAQAITTLMPFVSQILLLFGDMVAQVLPQLLPVLMTLAGVIGSVAVAIMPVVSALLTALMPILEALMPIITGVLGAFLPLISTLVSALAPILIKVAELLGPLLTPILGVVTTLVEALTPVIELLTTIGVNGLTAAITFLMPIIEGVVNALGSILIPVVDTVTKVFKGLIDFIVNVFQGNWEGAWDAIVGIFGDLFNGMVDIAKGVINGLIDLINGFLGGLNDVGGWLSDITGGTVGFSIGQIPHLADGATVLPRAGGTLAVLGEAGRAETVVDHGLMNRAITEGLQGTQGGRGGNTFNVFPKETDGRILVRQLQSEAERAS